MPQIKLKYLHSSLFHHHSQQYWPTASGYKIAWLHKGCSASTLVIQRVPGKAESPCEHPALLQEPLTLRAQCRLLPDCCISCSGFFQTFPWQDETDKRILLLMLWIVTHCQQRIHSAHTLKGTLSKIYVLLLYSPNGNPGLLAITHHLCLTYKVPHKRSLRTVI